MSYRDKLQQIDELQQKITTYGKLPDEVLKKINYKFRLEWNYNSNSMEGNTLTKAETKELMANLITFKDSKPLKDVLEMKGHDEIISTIMKMGMGELNISEKRIKDIHAIIKFEDEPEKKQLIGKWKTYNNYVDENNPYYFTPHADVPDEMHRLINWTNIEVQKIKRRAKDALHPVTLAAEFHIRFITIHPFHDGNGRMVRILTNLILIGYGYPSIYVDKETDRDIYYNLLRSIQREGASHDLFHDFTANLVIRSQRLVTDIIEDRYSEAEDIDKEIELFKRQRPNEKDKVVTKSYDIVQQLYETCFSDMYNRLHAKLHTNFYDMFNTWEVLGYVNGRNSNRQNKIQFDNFFSINVLNGDFDETGRPRIENMCMNYDLKGFNRDTTNTFNVYYRLEIEFGEYNYIVKDNHKQLYEKLYSQPLTEQEIQYIISNAQKTIFEEIKQRTNH